MFGLGLLELLVLLLACSLLFPRSVAHVGRYLRKSMSEFRSNQSAVKWLGLGCLLGTLTVSVGWCSGIIHPRRPMFHHDVGLERRLGYLLGLGPYWIPNHSWSDDYGHFLHLDDADNLLVLHATGGVASGNERIAAGMTETRFRLGDAEADWAESKQVTTPRTRDALVVILPDGRWLQFPLRSAQAVTFFKRAVGGAFGEEPDLLAESSSLLAEEAKMEFDEFVKGYVRPAPNVPKAKE